MSRLLAYAMYICRGCGAEIAYPQRFVRCPVCGTTNPGPGPGVGAGGGARPQPRGCAARTGRTAAGRRPPLVIRWGTGSQGSVSPLVDVDRTGM